LIGYGKVRYQGQEKKTQKKVVHSMFKDKHASGKKKNTNIRWDFSKGVFSWGSYVKGKIEKGFDSVRNGESPCQRGRKGNQT